MELGSVCRHSCSTKYPEPAANWETTSEPVGGAAGVAGEGPAVATRLLFRTGRGAVRVFPFFIAGGGAAADELRAGGAAATAGASRVFPFLTVGEEGGAGEVSVTGACPTARSRPGAGRRSATEYGS